MNNNKTSIWKKIGSYIDQYDDKVDVLRCMACGFQHDYCLGNISLTDCAWFYYCPNCGARMEADK